MPRVIGRVDAFGTADASTTVQAFSANNICGVTSADGRDIWVTGSSDGVQHTTFGATSSTSVSSTNANLRAVKIFTSLTGASISGVAGLGAIYTAPSRRCGVSGTHPP